VNKKKQKNFVNQGSLALRRRAPQNKSFLLLFFKKRCFYLHLMTDTTKLRSRYARLVAARGGARNPRIEQAFATVEREKFAGPGPWSLSTGGGGYRRTPDSDPHHLYEDTLIALNPERGLNIGEPSAHACWLDALALQEGETVLQVGAGSGYYTAIMAYLVGPTGCVHAFEIDPTLAQRARENLRDLPQVHLHTRSGIADDLPMVDAVYVNAGITQPCRPWLNALRPHGRLLFPLQGEASFGGMLLITRPKRGTAWPARFVSRAGFVACSGPQDPDAARRLDAAFARRAWDEVKSFRTDNPADSTCWFAGEDWWLSTNPPEGSVLF